MKYAMLATCETSSFPLFIKSRIFLEKEKKKKEKEKKGIKCYCSSICFATKQQGIPLAELQGQLSLLYVTQSPRALNTHICRKQFSNLSPILLTDCPKLIYQIKDRFQVEQNLNKRSGSIS